MKETIICIEQEIYLSPVDVERVFGDTENDFDTYFDSSPDIYMVFTNTDYGVQLGQILK